MSRSLFGRTSLKALGVGAVRTFQVFCAFTVISDHVVGLRMSMGNSMVPTLPASESILVVESISPRLNPPRLKQGDVIVFTKPTNQDAPVCKRILAMAGDTVCVDPLAHPLQHVIVPAGHVWVSGDNMPNSIDSRTYGPVPLGLIKSKVIATVWPSLGAIRNTFAELA